MWHAYRLVYRLESPLHIGWRKVGNLMQTRPYVTGRAMWGATTANLTQWLGSYNYPVVGDLVRENLIFGYFFPATDPNHPYLPCWRENQLHYGSLPAEKFEQDFLGSRTSTAIDYRHNTASEGQLHEVEFVSPHVYQQPVFLVGHLLARTTERIACTATQISVDGVPLFEQAISQLQIGGERRYGFGRITLDQDQISPISSGGNLFQHALRLDSEHPMLEVTSNHPLPAHFEVASVSATGELEPLRGAEWDEKGPGRHLSAPLICWMPGAKLAHSCLAVPKSLGVWTLL
jgi:hypothetical protein